MVRNLTVAFVILVCASSVLSQEPTQQPSLAPTTLPVLPAAALTEADVLTL